MSRTPTEPTVPVTSFELPKVDVEIGVGDAERLRKLGPIQQSSFTWNQHAISPLRGIVNRRKVKSLSTRDDLEIVSRKIWPDSRVVLPEFIAQRNHGVQRCPLQSPPAKRVGALKCLVVDVVQKNAVQKVWWFDHVVRCHAATVTRP